MGNLIFPYGPPPRRLENLILDLSQFDNLVVDLNVLEKMNISKTQGSITFSGLKHFGFIDHDNKLTNLVKEFANKKTRYLAAKVILDTVYKPLFDIVINDKDNAIDLCNKYLVKLGRGDSAREKILKLFWYFYKEAKIDHIPVKRKEPVIRQSNISNTIELKNVELEGETNLNPIQILAQDDETLKLVEHLISFVDKKQKLLVQKRQMIIHLEKECSELEVEIKNVQSTLNLYKINKP